MLALFSEKSQQKINLYRIMTTKQLIKAEKRARREALKKQKQQKKENERKAREVEKELRKKQRQEETAARLMNRNEKFLAKLNKADAESTANIDARKLLEAVSAGLVSRGNPAVLSARKLLGRHGDALIHRDELADRIIHDPLRQTCAAVDAEVVEILNVGSR